jgi:hypothetical protein
MAMTMDAILNSIYDETMPIEAAGISSDEEEDLDSRLGMSDSDPRQVFTCFYEQMLSCHGRRIKFTFDATVNFDAHLP